MKWLRIKSLNVDRNKNEWHFLEHLDCHESDAWIETKEKFFESSSKNGELSIKTLVGEIITVVTETNESDYRDKSIILFFF